MKKSGLIILLLNFVFYVSAQNTESKSALLASLKTAKDDTAKIRLLIQIQKLYATKDYDSSMYYLKMETALAEKLKDDFFIFYINVGYMEYYYYHNDYRKAIDYALKNKAIAEKENDMQKLAKSYNNLSAIYNHFGLYKFAIEYVLKCLELSEKTKDSTSFPIRNLTASNTYYNLKQFDKSITYANKAIEYGKKFNNEFAVMMGINNLSANYAYLYKLDTTILLNKQQFELAKQSNDIVNINYSLINICVNYFKLADEKNVANYTLKLNEYSRQYPDEQIIAQVYNVNALYFVLQGKYKLAKVQLDSGIIIAKNSSNTDALQNLFHTYYVLNFMEGNIAEGEKNVFKYDSLITSLNLKDLNFYTEELETKYKTEKKEETIRFQKAQLHNKNIINYILASLMLVFLLLSMLIFFFYKNRQQLQKAKIQELEKEKQLQATEAILKGQEEERSRIAKDLHDGLGGILSGLKYSLNDMKENVILSAENATSFTRSIDMLDSGIQELRRIAHNMMPENLVKFGLDTALHDYCQSISSTNVLHITYASFKMEDYKADINVNITIYRIIQELINNTIKHANATEMIVQVSHDENKLHVTVEDNGKGFDVGQIRQFKGAGWSNIFNRVEYLKGRIDIDSDAKDGTAVNIEIPLS